MLEWDKRDSGMLLRDAHTLEAGPRALRQRSGRPHTRRTGIDSPAQPASHVPAANPGTPVCSNGTAGHCAPAPTEVHPLRRRSTRSDGDPPGQTEAHPLRRRPNRPGGGPPAQAEAHPLPNTSPTLTLTLRQGWPVITGGHGRGHCDGLSPTLTHSDLFLLDAPSPRSRGKTRDTGMFERDRALAPMGTRSVASVPESFDYSASTANHLPAAA